MARAFLLLFAMTAQAQGAWLADDAAGRVAVLDAAGVVAVDGATPERRTVAVTCPPDALCRLIASVEGPGGAVAMGLAAVALDTPPVAVPLARAHACRGEGPCALATGLPPGRSLMTLALTAQAGALAPAGDHPFHVRLGVVVDPAFDVAPLDSPSPTPLTRLTP